MMPTTLPTTPVTRLVNRGEGNIEGDVLPNLGKLTH